MRKNLHEMKFVQNFFDKNGVNFKYFIAKYWPLPHQPRRPLSIKVSGFTRDPRLNICLNIIIYAPSPPPINIIPGDGGETNETKYPGHAITLDQ